MLSSRDLKHKDVLSTKAGDSGCFPLYSRMIKGQKLMHALLKTMIQAACARYNICFFSAQISDKFKMSGVGAL